LRVFDERKIRLKTFWRLAAASCFSLFLAGTSYAQTTTLIVHHNANLPADHTAHSRRSRITSNLAANSMTVEPNKTLGFSHAQTAAGVDGWIYQTLVHVEEQDEIPTGPATTGIETSIDPMWTKPAIVGSVLQGPSEQTCPADGEAGGDLETNKRKNHKDTPLAITPLRSAHCKACRSPTRWAEVTR
jgi:hypothetical protein